MWMFWVCWLFPTWYEVDCSQLVSWFDSYQLQLVYLTVENHPTRNLQHEIPKTAFDTSISHSTFSIHCADLFMFLLFSCIFTILEIIRHTILKMYFFLPSSVLKWLHENSPVLIFFLMQADMTAVTMQSRKNASNEVRQQSTTKAILWVKNINELFGQPNM